jgi:dTDP-4-amino-4,6-dideoxygalactose transaminase
MAQVTNGSHGPGGAENRFASAGRRNASQEWSVPLAPPLIREEELAEVVETYRSGWLSMGPRTAELEAAFREYARVPEAIAVSSCSAALHLACLTAGLGPGDTAILPSLTFAATANAVACTGARPRFADIRDLERPWLSVDAVEEALEPSTKAIINVSYGGHLGETAELAELARSRGLVLLEDAAHGSGSWSDGRHAGTFGLAGALSFSASKNLGIGEGGMLLTSSADVAERARIMRWHGISKSSWDRHRSDKPQYDLDDVGFNYRIDDPRAALARARLRSLDHDNRKRAAIDAAYREALADEEQLTPTAAPPGGERASHCMFTVVLDEGTDRDSFRAHLTERGVQTSLHFPPLHNSGLHCERDMSLPLTEAYARRSVSLPIFAHMEPWQQELVVEATSEGLARQKRAVAA